jgi:tetratricopeptide (TPR) repeat protein
VKLSAPLCLFALIPVLGCRPAPGTSASNPIVVPPPGVTTPVPTRRPSPFLSIARRFPAPASGKSVDQLEGDSAKKPEDLLALKALGLGYFNAGGYTPAAATLAKVPADPEARLYLGLSQLGDDKLAGGTATLTALVQDKNTPARIAARAWLVIGDSYYLGEDGREVEAEKAYAEALRLDPKLGDAALALGTIAAQNNQKNKAKTYFEQAAKLLPAGERRARAFASLGRLLGDADAKNWYEKALKDDPKNAWALSALKKK